MNTKEKIIALIEQYIRTAKINGDTRSPKQLRPVIREVIRVIDNDCIPEKWSYRRFLCYMAWEEQELEPNEDIPDLTNTTKRCIEHISTYLD